MRRFALFASVFAAAAAFATETHATSLRPLAPYVVSFGGRDAVIFYRPDGAQFEVVITVAANSPDNGISMRSVVSLLPGQRSTVSIGNDHAGKPDAVTISRDGDTLTVLPPNAETASR